MYEANLTVAAVRSCSSISFLSQQWKEIVDVYLQNKWLFNSIYALKTLKSLAPPWATPRAFEHAALWSCGEGSGTNQFSKVQMPYPTAEFDHQMPPYTIWKHIQSIWNFLCIPSKHCNVCWDPFWRANRSQKRSTFSPLNSTMHQEPLVFHQAERYNLTLQF